MSPSDEDRAGQEAIRRLMESLADATGVLGGIRDYLTLLEDRYRGFTRRVLRRSNIVTIGLVIAIAVVASAQRKADRAATSATTSAAEVKRLALENRLGLRVSCTLLAQTIADATADGHGKPRTRALRLSRERNAIFVRIVSRGATRAERERIATLTRQIARAGGAIPTPPCDDVAEHPERYREVVR